MFYHNIFFNIIHCDEFVRCCLFVWFIVEMHHVNMQLGTAIFPCCWVKRNNYWIKKDDGGKGRQSQGFCGHWWVKRR